MERKLGILVLNVDAIEGVSGAACRLPDLDVVLINRLEVEGRRHFDLAHELFHILTWDTMPPQHVEEASEYSKTRVEQLANNFASTVLMPSTMLEQFGPWSSDLSVKQIIARLNAAADKLAVTATALKWRLVAIGKLEHTKAKGIPDAALRNNGHEIAQANPPPLFSKSFVEVIALAIREGHVSVRRAADLLDLSLDDLADLCTTYGVQSPVEL
jgi:Zn-dependent peptidase ImmA (M78 family)